MLFDADKDCFASHIVIGDLTPNPLVSTFFKNKSDRKMLSSVRYLAGVVEHAIGRSSVKIKEKIEMLLSEDWKRGVRVSSMVHIQHTLLKLAVENNNVKAANMALDEMQEMQILTSSLKYGALMGEAWSDSHGCYILNALNSSSMKTYGKMMDVAPPTSERAKIMHRAIGKALDVLESIDSALYQEVFSVVTDLVYYESTQTTSGSSFNCLGLVSMNCVDESQNWTTALEMIVHEATHQHVFNIMVDERLILNEGQGMYKSALRKDPRPMSGIFHGLVVVARLIYLASKVDQSGILKKEGGKFFPSRNNARNTAPYLDKFNDLLSVVEDNARLSSLGWEIVESCKILSRNPVDDAMFCGVMNS